MEINSTTLQELLNSASPIAPTVTPKPGEPVVTLPGQDGQPGPSVPLSGSLPIPSNPAPVELDDETKAFIELTPEERATLDREQEEARIAMEKDSAHDEEFEIDDLSNEVISESSADTEERPQELETVHKKDGKVEAFVLKGIDPQDPEAPRVGNWELTMPGMSVKARSDDGTNRMDLVWNQVDLLASSKTTSSIANTNNPECVVETSKISCVFPKPDKDLDDISFSTNHLTVNIKNETDGRTRMDVICDEILTPSQNDVAPAQGVKGPGH